MNIECTSPAQVAGLTGVSAIAASQYHTVALKNDGTVWAWGYNSYGELGDGTTITRSTPVQATGLTGVVVSAIAAGNYYTVAIKKADGSVWSWGSNSSGKLGNGSTENSKIPVQATGLTGVSAIAARGSYTVALTNQESIISWGYNNYGQFGIGNKINSSVPVPTNFSIEKPDATTSPAISVTANNATLIGAINPKGVATASYYFEYGTTNTYSSSSKTSSRSAGLEKGSTQVMSNLVELIPNTTYHFRLVATNCVGKVEGVDQTFTTTSPVSPTPVSDSYSVTPVIVSGGSQIAIA